MVKENEFKNEKMREWKSQVEHEIKNNRIIPPAVIIGIVSSVVFYALIGVRYNINPRLLLFAVILCFSIFLFIKLIYKVNTKNKDKLKTILSKKRNNKKTDKTVKKVSLSFLGIGIGLLSVLNLLIHESKIVTLADTSKVTHITAELVSEPKPTGKYYKISAKIISCGYITRENYSGFGNINLFFPKEVVDQNLAGGISKIKSYAGDDCRIFVRGVVLKARGRFSSSEKYKGVQAFFAYPELPKFKRWKSSFASFRGHLRFNLMRLLYSWGSAGALLLALLAADRNFLCDDIRLIFINCGLAHVLALSGMHVSIIGSSGSKTGKLFFGKKIAVKISLIAILFFVWFAGSAPSLNRAIGMAVILIFGRALGLKPKTISVMLFMLIIHLLIKPADALTLGFMLSYAALAGILLFAKAITTILEGKFPKAIISSFAASIGAQSFTAPIITFFIGRIAVIGIIASSIISPMIALYLIVGIIFIFLSMLLPIIAFALGKILNIMFNCIFACIKFFAVVTPLQPQTLFASICFALIPIFFGIICMKYAHNIFIERLAFAKNTL